MRPPGWRPPGARPPGWRPPGYRPPRPGHLPVYGPGFWGRHPDWRWRWASARRNWWAWATVGSVTGWLIGSYGEPIYYDYGTNIYYEGDNVYYNDELVATTDEYAEQAQRLAEDVPEVDPQNVDWLPLGVFALSAKNSDDVENATIFLQLAISKQGIIAGTFRNTATDKAVEVEGTIDRESQRAAWGPVHESWPIMETGLYNLTENEAGALVHFADGQTQQWMMVRLEEPNQEGQESSKAAESEGE